MTKQYTLDKEGARQRRRKMLTVAVAAERRPQMSSHACTAMRVRAGLQAAVIGSVTHASQSTATVTQRVNRASAEQRRREREEREIALSTKGEANGEKKAIRVFGELKKCFM